MKTVITAAIAATLLISAPAWADDDDHGGKHWNKHAHKQWKKEQKHWDKHHRHAERHARHFHDEQVVHRYYYPPHVTHRHVTQHHHYYAEPVRYAPPPGVTVVLPNVYIPFR